MYQVNRSYCVSDIIINDILAGPTVERMNKTLIVIYTNIRRNSCKINLLSCVREKIEVHAYSKLHLIICTVK